MNENTRQFIGDKTAELIKGGISVKFVNKPSLKSNGYAYGGSFCNANKEIKVATKGSVKKWLSIFIHEYNHFVQWKEDSQIWKKGDKGCTIFWTWLEGVEEYKPEVLEKATFNCMAMEHDCEYRSFKMIEEYNLPIKHDYYAKWANVYLYFHKFALEHKKWYNTAVKNKTKEYDMLINSMPDIIFEDANEYWNLPKNYEKLISPFLSNC